jgi:hypothetical protein
MSEFKLGTTKLTQGYERGNYFNLELGDNFYRVLPPLFSLADEGKVAKYHAYHMGFKNTEGKVRPFLCPEVQDRKNKLITTHCPVCDDVSEKESKVDTARKTPGITDDQKKQLQEYFMKTILPFKVNRGYFVNAIDQKGEIGLLRLPYTAFKSLEIELKKQQDKGIDPTGIEGIYLNFKKTAAYKGDKETKYDVSPALVQEGDAFRLKRHTLTPEIIESLKTKAKDLSTLYKSIKLEEVAMLQGAAGDDRAKLVDRIFGKPEDKANTTGSILESSIPGTTATAVGRAEVGASGVNVVMPNVAAAQPTVDPLAGLGLPKSTPSAAAPKAPVDPLAGLGVKAGPTVTTPSQGVSAMSDDDFARMFAVGK